MKTRLIRIFLLAALAIPMSGCPVTGISLGTWLLTVDSNLVGIIFDNDGQTQVPVPLPQEADTSFNGTVTWELNDSTITLTQVTSTRTNVYTGTLESRTRIVNGTWMTTAGGSASGTWTGEKLD